MQKTLNSLEPILQAEFDPAFEIRARYILDTAAEHNPKRVLDAGCGRGFYVHSYSYLPTVEEIHGVEINPKYIEVAKKHCTDERIKITEGSIYELPYPDNYFDFISCSEVLEHLSDDAKGLSELKRVLKPTGKLVVTVPNHHFPFLWDPLNWLLMKLFNTHINKDIWWLAGIWADHVRLYTTEQLTTTVEKAGFTIQDTKLVVSRCWPLAHFWLYGVGKNIVERLGATEFDRFNFKERPLASALATFVKWPSKNLKVENPKASVNIAMILQK